MQKRLSVSEIVWREDLYPRFEPDQRTIQRYSESVEFLPPIKVNQANILIDGFHRWKAHQLAGLDSICVTFCHTRHSNTTRRLSRLPRKRAIAWACTATWWCGSDYHDQEAQR